MPFLGTVTERDCRKRIQSTETSANDASLRSGFFFRKTRSVTVPRFGFFFQDSRIRVKSSKKTGEYGFCLKNEYFLKTFLQLYDNHQTLLSDPKPKIGDSPIQLIFNINSQKI